MQDNHVLTFDHFTGKPEADIEDVLGWRNYLALVNYSYALERANVLTDAEAPNERVVKKVEERFGTMPVGIPEFDHFSPSEYLIRNRDAVLKGMPDLNQALDRFENIFKQLNAMLPSKV